MILLKIINNKNNKFYANIKILEKYKVGGFGIILIAYTTTKGNIQRNYIYRCKNKDIIFQIKSFENNFCPTEFVHPSNNILITINMILGNIRDINIDDDFVFVSSE